MEQNHTENFLCLDGHKLGWGSGRDKRRELKVSNILAGLAIFLLTAVHPAHNIYIFVLICAIS